MSSAGGKRKRAKIYARRYAVGGYVHRPGRTPEAATLALGERVGFGLDETLSEKNSKFLQMVPQALNGLVGYETFNNFFYTSVLYC
jgi:hypothetical protein